MKLMALCIHILTFGLLSEQGPWSKKTGCKRARARPVSRQSPEKPSIYSSSSDQGS
jgi:hypothetical protein